MCITSAYAEVFLLLDEAMFEILINDWNDELSEEFEKPYYNVYVNLKVPQNIIEISPRGNLKYPYDKS